MIPVGIEAINVFGGTVYLDVMQLAKHRNLDSKNFEKMMINKKTVALPYEDPVTFGVNAAKPIVDSLSEAEKKRIELVITCTESGIDFGKSISTYIHHYLGLNRNCRLFEIKNACYAGTAGLQMAINFILSQTSPGAKALVITTDISRFMTVEDGKTFNMDWAFMEPTSGAGAAAVLVSEEPAVFRIDEGANGYYGYEVMDTCRPIPDGEAGDTDLGLMSFLDCCEQSFLEYQKRVTGVDYRQTFQYLAFHTPFGAMIKAAHRTMMRKIAKAATNEIEADFQRRVAPGITYCQQVGNIMGSTIFLSLLSIIDNATFASPKRIGCYSYGSGCCAEFFSGVVTEEGQKLVRSFQVEKHLNGRYQLSMEDYEKLLKNGNTVKFGTRNITLDFDIIPGAIRPGNDNKRLFLKEINEFHRKYSWE